MPQTLILAVSPTGEPETAIARAAALLRDGKLGRLSHRDGLRPRRRRDQTTPSPPSSPPRASSAVTH